MDHACVDIFAVYGPLHVYTEDVPPTGDLAVDSM